MANEFRIKKGLIVNETDLYVSGSKLGIGTDTPSQTLTVAGNISGSGTLTIDGAATIDGTLTATGGINGLTLANGISGNNFNISGVNQVSISDPGEGIVFGGGASGNITLAIVDDASDNILRLSGTGAQLQVGTNRVLTTADEGSGNGIDADTLDGQEGSYYQNASNLNAGTVSDARLPGTISSDITGNAATATKWATGRTLTIGDTGKSVDGSGNITWSRTEIGITKTNIDALNIDADTIDGLNSTQFLRSDANDTTSGNLTINGVATVNNDLVVNESGRAILVKGTGAADATDSMYIEFQLSNGTQVGYIGDPTGGATRMDLLSSVGDLFLIAASSDINLNASNGTINFNTGVSGTTATFTGDLTVGGKVTAEEFHTEFVSASIIYQSGSTKFGDTSDDIHSFSGSVSISGSAENLLTLRGMTPTGAGGLKVEDPTAAAYGAHFTYLDGATEVSIGGITNNTRNDVIRLDRDTTQTVKIDNTGVGINTASPSSELHVNGDTYVTGEFGQGVAIADKVLNYGAEFRTSGASIQIVYGRDSNSVGSGGIGADNNSIFSAWNIDSGASEKFRIGKDGQLYITQYIYHDGDEDTYLNFGTNSINLRAGGGTDNINITTSEVVINEGGSGYDFRVESDTTTHALFVPGSTGNVGIGNTGPEYSLDIGAENQDNPTDFIRLNPTNGNSDGTSNTLGTGLIWKPHYTSYTKRSAGIVQVGEGNFFRSGLAFYTNNTADQTTDWQERMRIDKDGNVGIGTTSVTGKFNSYITAARQITHNGNGGDLSVISDNNSTPVMYIKGTGTADLLNVFDNTTEVFTILDGGNVGINTTSPDEKLHVVGNSLITGDGYFGTPNANEDSTSNIILSQAVGGSGTHDFITIADTTNDGGETSRIVFKNRYGTGDFTNGQESSFIANERQSTSGIYDLLFGTATAQNEDASEKMRITHEGNVGIGTTSPSSLLDISGNSNSSDNMVELINTKYSSTDTAGETGILFGWGNHVAARITAFKEGAVNRTGFKIIGEAGFNVPTTIATFRSTGLVGIGTTNPSTTLTVGDGTADTRVTIDKADNNVSDHLIFEIGGTRVGEIGAEDTTWLRINQETAKNIYTPRYIRADGGFFVDGTSLGINGFGRLLDGSLTGTYSNNLTFSGTTTFTGNLFADAYARIDALRVGTTSTDPGDGNLYVEGNSQHGGTVGYTSFNSGFGGNGWRIDQNANAEFANLTVRGTFSVYELLAQQIRATNGSLLVATSGKVDTSTGGSTGTLTFDTGNVYGHGFLANDILLAQRLDTDGASLKRTFLRVDTRVDSGSLTYTVLNGNNPEAGQEFVRIGNTTNTDRQGHIYLTADDSYAPFIGVRDGVDAYTDFTSGTGSVEKVRVGRLDGVTSTTFGSLNGYGLWASGSVYLEGGINATFGNIAGWTINTDNITGGDATLASSGNLTLGTSNNVVRLSADDGTYRLWTGHATAGSAPFRVTKAGAVTATSATITGNITAETGYIGTAAAGFNINSSYFANGKTSLTDANAGVYVGTDGISLGASSVFKVTNAGALSATSATISGNITAGSGQIADWTIISDAIFKKVGSVYNIIGRPDDISGAWTTTWENGLTVGKDGNNRMWFSGDQTGNHYEMAIYSASTYIVRLGTNENKIAGWTIDNDSIFSGTRDISGYSTSGITLYSGGSIHAPNFYIDTSGDAFFKGTLSAPDGNIGGFTIATSQLHTGTKNTFASTAAGVYVGTDGIALGTNSPFNVNSSGDLVASSATITGNITAETGYIGTAAAGFNINSTYFANGKSSLTDASAGVYVGTDGISLGPSSVFKVENDGTLTATSATITGAITATSGTFTGTVNANAGNFTSTVNIGNGATTGTLAVGTATNKITIVGTNADTTTKIHSGTGTYSNTNTGFYMDASGRFSLKDKLTWDGTTLTVNGGGTFSGDISAASGTFTGDLSGANISGGTIDIGGADATSFHVDSDGQIWSGDAAYSNAPFRVSSGGAIRAQSGLVGGWTVGASSLTGGSGATTIGLIPGTGIHLGNAVFGSSPFRVTNAGVLSATGATISGDITATNITATTAGNIGGWSIESDRLNNGNVYLSNASNEKGLFVGDGAGAPYRLQVGEFSTVTPTSTTLSEVSANSRVATDTGTKIKVNAYSPFSFSFDGTGASADSGNVLIPYSTTIAQGDTVNASLTVDFTYLNSLNSGFDSFTTLATITLELLNGTTVLDSASVQRSSIYGQSKTLNVQYYNSSGTITSGNLKLRVSYSSQYNRTTDPSTFQEVGFSSLTVTKDEALVSITNNQALFYQGPNRKFEWTPGGIIFKGGTIEIDDLQVSDVNVLGAGSIVLDEGNIDVGSGRISINSGLNQYNYVLIDPNKDTTRGSILEIGSTTAEMITLNRYQQGTYEIGVNGGSGTPEFTISKNGTNEYFRIDTDGKVGINTSDPGSKLHVVDATDIAANGSGDGQLTIGGNGYSFGIALDAQAAHLYHNSSLRNIEIGTDEGTDLTIHSNGNVTIHDGNLIVASGHGIDFSATGQASGMSSELLDDYEEGTFTPSIHAGATSPIYNSNNYGKYTKVGNVVHCSGRFQVDEIIQGSSVTNVELGGFPFVANTPLSSGTGASAGVIGFASGFDGESPTMMQIRDNETNAFLYYQNASLGISNLKGDDFASGEAHTIVFQITYHTA